MAVKPTTRTIDFGDMLPIGWRFLNDALVVRAALEDQAGGDSTAMLAMIAEDRVVKVPDLAEVDVVMTLPRTALVRFIGEDGESIEAWTARAAVEPQEAPGEAEEEGRPHQAITSRPKGRRD